MRLLILTTAYHPAITPNVARWGTMARYWAGHGHTVHVVCSQHGSAPAYEVVQKVQVHRVSHNTLGSMLGRNPTIQQQARTAKRLPGLRQLLLHRAADILWRSWYWPDGRMLWWRAARKKAARLIEEHQLEAMVTVGLPFSTHWAGLQLRRQFPQLDWLVDIEDPFSIVRSYRINNPLLYTRLNRQAERMVLQQADQVVFTVEQARRRYQVAFPEVDTPMSVIPPMISLPAADDYPSFVMESRPTEELHIGYFGAFYTRIREPAVLIAGLNRLSQVAVLQRCTLRLHHFGAIEHRYARQFLGDHEFAYSYHGLHQPAVVASAMQQMDLLLSLGNTTSYHLPSKSVDYLASGKPVLHLWQHPDDPYLQVFEQHPLFFGWPVGPKEDLQAVASFVRQAAGQRLPSDQLADLVSPFRPVQVIGAYGALLKA